MTFDGFVIGLPGGVHLFGHGVGEDVFEIGFDALEDLVSDVRGGGFRHVDAGEHVGVDGTGEDGVDVDVAFGEVGAKGLGEGPGGGFGSVIDAEAGHAGEGDESQEVRDGTATIGFDDGDEGSGGVEEAVEVGVEVAAEGFGRGVEDVAEIEDAGVVDEEVDVGGGLDGGGELGGLGDVERQGHDTGGVEGDEVRKAVEVAGGGVNTLSAAGEKGLNEGSADATVGAGDEGGGVLDLHESSVGGEGGNHQWVESQEIHA